MKIAAIITTYNRKEMLKETIKAILSQTYHIDKIIIVDNNSSDGTKEFITQTYLKNPNFTYIRLSYNAGPAGAFYEGIKYAFESKYDWFWLFDDDAIPNKDTLRCLVEVAFAIPSVGYLSPHTLWIDGSDCVMNIPSFVDNSIIEVKGIHLRKIWTCAWGGLFLNRKCVEVVKFPLKELFINGEDGEYTYRIYKTGMFENFQVLDAKIIHRTKENKGTNWWNITSENRFRYYHSVKNALYMFIKGYMPRKNMVKSYLSGVLKVLLTLPKGHVKAKLYVLIFGTIKGLALVLKNK